MVLALVRDLLFSTKITATARALSVPCQVVRDPHNLASAGQSPMLLVDLNLPGSIDAASCYQRTYPDSQVIGFVSHTDAATIRRAREAGIDRVLARSAFVDQLETLMRPLES